MIRDLKVKINKNSVTVYGTRKFHYVFMPNTLFRFMKASLVYMINCMRYRDDVRAVLVFDYPTESKETFKY